MNARLLLLLVACERTEPPPPAAKPVERPAWPRLTEQGFAGMSPHGMAMASELGRKFPGIQVEARQPAQLALLHAGVELGTIDYETEATKVILDAPGILTTHGLEVGASLARVLELDGHDCEALAGVLDSFAKVHHAVRCWVGPHFRYVAHLDAAPTKPLDAWLRATHPPITTIYWTLTPRP